MFNTSVRLSSVVLVNVVPSSRTTVSRSTRAGVLERDTGTETTVEEAALDIRISDSSDEGELVGMDRTTRTLLCVRKSPRG